jgi:hypothetical protein
VVREDGHLIAGAHRLAAGKRLQWSEIRAEISDDRSADLMALMEIDENLMRADLSAAERAAHQAARKAAYEREFPETKVGGAGRRRPKAPHGEEPIPSYARHAAKAQGTSRQTVEREAARGW